MSTTALKQRVTVGVFKSHAEAEEAITQLHHAGFDMTKLSIVGKDYETNEKVVGYYTTGDRMKRWGGAGAFWGGIWGLLFGAGFFLVPGIGPVVVAGPLVAAIIGALESAALLGGISAIGAGLFSLGIPKDSVLAYETALRAGKFVLVVHGNGDEARQAHELLVQANAELADEHAA